MAGFLSIEAKPAGLIPNDFVNALVKYGVKFD
jgi:hypothetical protein